MYSNEKVWCHEIEKLIWKKYLISQQNRDHCQIALF